MKKNIINFMVSHQIQNNETNLELLDLQLELYSKLLKNATTQEERKKYQNKIDIVYKEISKKINEVNNLKELL